MQSLYGKKHILLVVINHWRAGAEWALIIKSLHIQDVTYVGWLLVTRGPICNDWTDVLGSVSSGVNGLCPFHTIWCLRPPSKTVSNPPMSSEMDKYHSRKYESLGVQFEHHLIQNLIRKTLLNGTWEEITSEVPFHDSIRHFRRNDVRHGTTRLSSSIT